MRRITISVEDDLADAFEQLISVKAYVNRSEGLSAFSNGVNGLF